MTARLWVTIVTSAAVGALVSALIGFANGALERRAKRRELLLDSAMKLAFARRETVLRIAESDNRAAELMDDVLVTEEYYKALDDLLKKGSLPQWLKERDSGTA